VAEVAAAARAGDLDAAHAKIAVLVLVDGLGLGGNHEAGPAAAGVEFSAAQEQERIAAGAVVVAGFMVLGECAGEGALVPFLRRISYCSGVSRARHSASVRSIFSGVSLMVSG